MKIRSIFGIVLASIFVWGSALPTSQAGEVKRREKHQQHRIAQGVKSGELTKGETRKLEKGERKIEKDRQKALSDGKMSPKEAAKLNQEENKESREIYEAKHNDVKS